MNGASSVLVAHGYTMADLHVMAASACRADRSLASDAHTRYDVAWSAIAEALTVAKEPPERTDLVRIGWQAIYAEVREMRHVFGFRDKDGTTEVASSPRFRQYWTLPPVSPDDGITERIAVGQILPVLPDLYRDAVVALAVHGDYQMAADALGISYKALGARLTVARRVFRARWFAPETPPPTKGTDRRVGAYGKELSTRCRAGHEWTPENTRWDKARTRGGAKRRACRACETARSHARTAAKNAASQEVA